MADYRKQEFRCESAKPGPIHDWADYLILELNLFINICPVPYVNKYIIVPIIAFLHPLEKFPDCLDALMCNVI